ncbi:MAG: hypothetical protein V9F04_11345 [Dermatophilaceae bacterium]
MNTFSKLFEAMLSKQTTPTWAGQQPAGIHGWTPRADVTGIHGWTPRADVIGIHGWTPRSR